MLLIRNLLFQIKQMSRNTDKGPNKQTQDRKRESLQVMLQSFDKLLKRQNADSQDNNEDNLQPPRASNIQEMLMSSNFAVNGESERSYEEEKIEMVGLDDALMQLQLEGQKQATQDQQQNTKLVGSKQIDRHQMMQNARVLDKLMSKTQGSANNTRISMSDGKDLVNFLLGKQDEAFISSRDNIKAKLESKKTMIRSNIIKEHAVEESSNESLCTSESLAVSSQQISSTSRSRSNKATGIIQICESPQKQKSIEANATEFINVPKIQFKTLDDDCNLEQMPHNSKHNTVEQNPYKSFDHTSDEVLIPLTKSLAGNSDALLQNEPSQFKPALELISIAENKTSNEDIRQTGYYISESIASTDLIGESKTLSQPSRDTSAQASSSNALKNLKKQVTINENNVHNNQLPSGFRRSIISNVPLIESPKKVIKRQHVFRERQSVILRNSLNNLLFIKKILLIPISKRSKEQQQKLLEYLKQVKVFKDLLQDDISSYQGLSRSIQLIDVDRGTTLFNEGEEGDLFYIIIEGEVEVLKASQVVINFENKANKIEERTMEDKIKAYYFAFREHYRNIFWPEMDIQQQEVDEILGINNERHDVNFAQPLNEFRYGFLLSYIKRREEDGTFINAEGDPVFLINKPLILLNKGAGFGELALMSSVKRMASVRTSTDSCLAILTRRDFTIIMRSAQKRKIAESVAFLKQFPFIAQLSHQKLQKLFYLLQKRKHVRNSVIFKQGDSIDGIFFIGDGELLYQSKQKVYKAEVAHSNWINPKVLDNNQNKVIDNRTIAEFSLNEIVGFEEIMRQKVLDMLKLEWLDDNANRQVRDKEKVVEQKFNDPTTKFRNFTCIVKSITATIYFLSVEDFEIFFRYLSQDQVKKGVYERSQMLKHQMDNIRNICQNDYNLINPLQDIEVQLSENQEIVNKKRLHPNPKRADQTHHSMISMRQVQQNTSSTPVFNFPTINSYNSLDQSNIDNCDSSVDNSIQCISKRSNERISTQEKRSVAQSTLSESKDYVFHIIDGARPERGGNHILSTVKRNQVQNSTQYSANRILQTEDDSQLDHIQSEILEEYTNNPHLESNESPQISDLAIIKSNGNVVGQDLNTTPLKHVCFKPKPQPIQTEQTFSGRNLKKRNHDTNKEHSQDRITRQKASNRVCQRSKGGFVVLKTNNSMQMFSDKKRQTQYFGKLPSKLSLKNRQDSSMPYNAKVEGTPEKSIKSLNASTYSQALISKRTATEMMDGLPYFESSVQRSQKVKSRNHWNNFLIQSSTNKTFNHPNSQQMSDRYMKQSVTLKNLRPTHQVSQSIDNCKSNQLIKSDYETSTNKNAKSVKLEKDRMPASVEIPFGSNPNMTKQDMVQTDFLQYPDSLVNQSKSLQNYTKLSRQQQIKLNLMRKAEQNSNNRKAEVVKNMVQDKEQNEQTTNLKSDQSFQSVSPVTILGQVRSRNRNIRTEQDSVYGNTDKSQYRFPNRDSPALIRIELPESLKLEEDSSRADKIETGQLNTRLLQVLDDFSGKQYNRAAHKKRIEVAQSKLDTVFDIKQVREKYDGNNDFMAGPVYKKILAQRKKAKKLGLEYKPETSHFTQSQKRLQESTSAPQYHMITQRSYEPQEMPVSAINPKLLIKDFRFQRGATAPKLRASQPFKQMIRKTEETPKLNSESKSKLIFNLYASKEGSEVVQDTPYIHNLETSESGKAKRESQKTDSTVALKQLAPRIAPKKSQFVFELQRTSSKRILAVCGNRRTQSRNEMQEEMISRFTLESHTQDDYKKSRNKSQVNFYMGARTQEVYKD